MTGVFDRLQKQIENKQKEGGITALDLIDLPPALRKIMRLMLRELQMNYPELIKAVEKFPEDVRLSPKDLDNALKTLSEQAWVIQIGEGERAIYKVNLRRKAGSKLGGGIWQSLDDKLKDKPDS
ncbi:MAG: hypothetical protein QGM50_03300 [Anaerolineae bacterium]|nr:hypothetical protein [Anaerolineae bacterium]MDK1080334.1 hypothetical protein [Anaerolineae bacterium]MDK1117797.1 hypothetical protein [Anaerolineae bacterium]